MTGMDVIASGDGASVVVTMAAAAPAAAAFRIPRKDLRRLIASLQAAADKIERPPPPGTPFEPTLADELPPPGQGPAWWGKLESVGGDPATPTVAIADATAIAGFAVLTLLMGTTHASLGIPKEYLSRIGAALLAMSADPARKQ